NDIQDVKFKKGVLEVPINTNLEIANEEGVFDATNSNIRSGKETYVGKIAAAFNKAKTAQANLISHILKNNDWGETTPKIRGFRELIIEWAAYNPSGNNARPFWIS